jgi:hypothetical protein
MPEISRFFGIIISIYLKDHLPPHFHAKYGEYWGKFSIETGDMIEGNLPRRAIRLVQDWIEIHETELMRNFEEAQKDNPDIKPIAPLQ